MAASLLIDDAAPLLTLTGPGGVGKTRLALAVAGAVSPHFADGVIWVDLAPLTDPALVPQMVASALGLTPSSDRPLTDVLVRVLHPRQALLLLDNCEHLLGVVAELTAALLSRCPALQVLATSRAPLRLRGEQVLPVPPLPLPAGDQPDVKTIAQSEAVQLFVERAHAAHPAFALTETTAAPVATLCRTLDGLPLAIELAAARVTVFSPGALLTALTDRLPVLAGGPRDLPARQQTIEATIAWSYALLAEPAQALFRRLAVFLGGFTLVAAQAVRPAGQTANDVVVGLTALVELNLVYRVESEGEPRFAMLETIREFGRELLRTFGEDDEVRDRHAAFFHGLVIDELDLANGLPGDDSWFGRAVVEENNLRQALAHFAIRGDALALNELSSALFDFWKYRSQYAEGRFWLEQALAQREAIPPRTRAHTLEAAAILIADHGDYGAAEPLIDEAVALARESADPFLLYVTLQSRGILAERQGDLPGAKVWLEESLRAARSAALARPDIGPPFGGTLVALGIVARRSGDTDAAVAAFAEAIRELRARGRRWTLGGALGELGVLQVYAGSLSEAAANLLEGIGLHWSLGDTAVLTRGLRGLAAVAAVTDQPHAAAHLLGAVDAIDPQTPFATIADWRDRDVVDWSLARLGESVAPAQGKALRVAGMDLSVAEAVALAREVAKPVLGADAVAEIWQATGAPDPGPTREMAVLPTAPVPASNDDEKAHPLTFREHDVLALLGQRLTDSEIAARLFISRKTASNHVSSILAKLGAANRREATAIAARRGLL